MNMTLYAGVNDRQNVSVLDVSITYVNVSLFAFLMLSLIDTDNQNVTAYTCNSSNTTSEKNSISKAVPVD